MTLAETTLAQLRALGPAPDAADFELAAPYTPILKFDAREPLLPEAAGYTVFHAHGESPSFPRRVELAAAGQREAVLGAALRRLDVDGICSNTPEKLRPGYGTGGHAHDCDTGHP